MTIDKIIFNPACRATTLAGKPILLCVSNILCDIGLEDFCNINTVGTKMLVGAGPHLNTLKETFPDVIYPGDKQGEKLARYFATADILVYPHRNLDNIEIILEAIACGTPVAAYDLEMLFDVLSLGLNGEVADTLEIAIDKCLRLDRILVSESSQRFL